MLRKHISIRKSNIDQNFLTEKGIILPFLMFHHWLGRKVLLTSSRNHFPEDTLMAWDVLYFKSYWAPSIVSRRQRPCSSFSLVPWQEITLPCLFGQLAKASGGRGTCVIATIPTIDQKRRGGSCKIVASRALTAIQIIHMSKLKSYVASEMQGLWITFAQV